MREGALQADTRASVLLLDDRPAVVDDVRQVLAPLRLNVLAAAPEQAATRARDQHDFAVALLGVFPGGPDPLAIARALRQPVRTRCLPILFLADANAAGFSAEEAYTLGAVDYLVRPVVPNILRAKVAGFVELYRQADLLRDLQRQALERELTRQARRQSEERFRHLADAAPLLLWAVGPDGRTAWFNRPWLEFRGRTLEQEARTGSADGVHEDDRSAYREAFDEAFANRQPFRQEYRLRRADGQYRWVLDCATPLHEPDGTFAGYLGSAFDITARRDAEDALRRVDREKSRYLAMLAHELRSPLAPILTSLTLLERAEFTDPGLVEAVRRIGRRIRHLVRLLDELLDVSRLNSGAAELKGERVDLARVVRVAAEDRRAALAQTELALEVKAPSTPVWVLGDRTRLEQVVDNLLDNAAKFTEPGGRVTVVTEADPARGVAVVRVTDTGMGLEPEIASQLFDVFSQADNSLDRPRGGLGLGLAVVRGVAERHGGTVTASSRGPGLGTEFLVTLPLEREPAALTAVAEEASPAPSPRRRVLVVEDNKDAAASLSVLLELMGHDVRVAYSGPEAIELAAEWPPEITISDIGLPGFDGFEVARRLRGRFGRKPLLVALTGYGRDEDRRQSREAGFDHHLVKPADPAVIQRMLSTSR